MNFRKSNDQKKTANTEIITALKAEKLGNQTPYVTHPVRRYVTAISAGLEESTRPLGFCVQAFWHRVPIGNVQNPSKPHQLTTIWEFGFGFRKFKRPRNVLCLGTSCTQLQSVNLRYNDCVTNRGIQGTKKWFYGYLVET